MNTAEELGVHLLALKQKLHDARKRVPHGTVLLGAVDLSIIMLRLQQAADLLDAQGQKIHALEDELEQFEDYEGYGGGRAWEGPYPADAPLDTIEKYLPVPDINLLKVEQELSKKWNAEGMCRSCGFHAALYEYGPIDEDWIDREKGVVWLPCRADGSHRGVQIDVSAALVDGG